MTRIYTDPNGVYVNAITSLADGTVVNGRMYQVGAGTKMTYIDFQTGSIAENGINGLTNESLLAILIHRTQILNSELPCEENRDALAHLISADANFKHRANKNKGQ